MKSALLHFNTLKKKKEEFKYGKLVEVSKVIFNDEFDLMEYPKRICKTISMDGVLLINRYKK